METNAKVSPDYCIRYCHCFKIAIALLVIGLNNVDVYFVFTQIIGIQKLLWFEENWAVNGGRSKSSLVSLYWYDCSNFRSAGLMK